MHNLTPIEIISASAGSGKTYKLVLSFLRTLLSSSNPNVYRKMIALTFTNKAVFEMKSRILNKLNEFSDLDNQDQMAAELCEFLEVSKETFAPREDLWTFPALACRKLHGSRFCPWCCHVCPDSSANPLRTQN